MGDAAADPKAAKKGSMAKQGSAWVFDTLRWAEAGRTEVADRHKASQERRSEAKKNMVGLTKAVSRAGGLKLKAQPSYIFDTVSAANDAMDTANGTTPKKQGKPPTAEQVTKAIKHVCHQASSHMIKANEVCDSTEEEYDAANKSGDKARIDKAKKMMDLGEGFLDAAEEAVESAQSLQKAAKAQTAPEQLREMIAQTHKLNDVAEDKARLGGWEVKKTTRDDITPGAKPAVAIPNTAVGAVTAKSSDSDVAAAGEASVYAAKKAKEKNQKKADRGAHRSQHHDI